MKTDWKKTKLTKWCLCCIYGDKVTTEQASEIMRRTAYNLTHNYGYADENEEFIEEVTNIIGYKDYSPNDWNDSAQIKQIEIEKKKKEEWEKTWGLLDLNALYTETINTENVKSWINWNGRIRGQKNVGAWCEPVDIYNDLKLIAQTFPFLHLYCTLMNNEENAKDLEPLLSFEVKNGKVRKIKTISKEELIYHKMDIKHYAFGTKEYDKMFKRRYIDNITILNKGEIDRQRRVLQSWANKVYQNNK